MKRILVLVLALGMVAAAASTTPAASEFKIGAIFASTGPASMLGLPEKNTAEMLAKELNEAGGINGKPVKLIFYDTEGDATKTVTATNKLINKDKVDVIIGPTTSGTSMAIIDLVTKERVPLISCAASIHIVVPVKHFVFKTPQTDTMAVEKIYETLKVKGIRKVAIITVSTGYGDSGRAELLRLALDYGLEIVADERYGGKDTDMTTQLTKIKGTDAQAIVCWGTNPGPAMIAKNRKQLGMTIPLFNSHGIASPKFIELSGGAAEGTFLPAGKLIVVDQLPASDPQKAVLAKYKADYEGRFGKGSVSTFGGHAWDAFQIAVTAIQKAEKAGGATRETIRDELEKVQGFVGTGGIFNMSSEDHIGLGKDAFVMVEIRNGTWNLAE